MEVEAAGTEIGVEAAVADMEIGVEVEAAGTEIGVEAAVADMETAAEVEVVDLGERTTGTIVDVLALREAAGVALIRASGIREKEGNADEACKSESL